MRSFNDEPPDDCVKRVASGGWTAQQHCWHEMVEMSDQLQVIEDSDVRKCCHCGKIETAAFQFVQSWEHGTHVPVLHKRHGEWTARA